MHGLNECEFTHNIQPDVGILFSILIHNRIRIRICNGVQRTSHFAKLSNSIRFEGFSQRRPGQPYLFPPLLLPLRLYTQPFHGPSVSANGLLMSYFAIRWGNLALTWHKLESANFSVGCWLGI